MSVSAELARPRPRPKWLLLMLAWSTVVASVPGIVQAQSQTTSPVEPSTRHEPSRRSPRRITSSWDDIAVQPSDTARSSSVRSPDDAVGWGNGSQADSAPAPSSDDMVGWGPEPGQAAQTSSSADAARSAWSAWSMGGRYRLRVALWTRHFAAEHPLAQARSWLALWLRYGHDFSLAGYPAAVRIVAAAHGEYDAAYAFQRADYPASTRQAYEWQVIPDETYADLTLGRFALRVGWLKHALGQGELFGFLNGQSPRDLRDPGLTDPEDLLLAVLGSRTSLALGDHRLELLTVQQAYFGLRAPPLGVLSPMRAWLLQDPLSAPAIAARDWRFREQPSGYAPSVWQALGHYGYTGPGIDLDVYAGSVLLQLGVARMPAPAQLLQRAVTLDNYHPRYALVGHAGALTLGQTLLRWELTAELSRPHNTRDVNAPLRLEIARYTQLNGLLGISYYGLSHSNFGVELAQSYVLHNPARQHDSRRQLLLPTERPQLALRAGFDLLHDRLQLLISGLIIGVAPVNGALVRAELTYLAADALRLSLGYVHYYSASAAFGPFYGLGRDNRVYCALRWDFSLI